jgi:hypothetical protein
MKLRLCDEAPTQLSLLERRAISVTEPMIRLRLGDEAPTQLGPFFFFFFFFFFVIIIDKRALFELYFARILDLSVFTSSDFTIGHVQGEPFILPDTRFPCCDVWWRNCNLPPHGKLRPLDKANQNHWSRCEDRERYSFQNVVFCLQYQMLDRA